MLLTAAPAPQDSHKVEHQRQRFTISARATRGFAHTLASHQKCNRKLAVKLCKKLCDGGAGREEVFPQGHAELVACLTC
jgi:hypothetical protein